MYAHGARGDCWQDTNTQFVRRTGVIVHRRGGPHPRVCPASPRQSCDIRCQEPPLQRHTVTIRCAERRLRKGEKGSILVPASRPDALAGRRTDWAAQGTPRRYLRVPRLGSSLGFLDTRYSRPAAVGFVVVFSIRLCASSLVFTCCITAPWTVMTKMHL